MEPHMICLITPSSAHTNISSAPYSWALQNKLYDPKTWDFGTRLHNSLYLLLINVWQKIVMRNHNDLTAVSVEVSSSSRGRKIPGKMHSISMFSRCLNCLINEFKWNIFCPPKKKLHVIYTSNDLKFASVNSPQEVKEGYICVSRADF